MFHVVKVAQRYFWDASYDAYRLPSEAECCAAPETLTDIAGMTGRERRNLLERMGVHRRLVLPCLRAMQHLTALFSRELVEDPQYLAHRVRSAQHWSYNGDAAWYTPLLGHPLSLSSADCAASHAASNPIPGPPGAVNAAREGAGNEQGAGNVSNLAGLVNQGSTCYLNSLLQTLYHLSQFRSIIYEMNTVDECPSANSKAASSIPLALQRLFCEMQTAGSQPVATTDLTCSFGWRDAESFIQHDIHELTRILLDNLEEKLEVRLRRLHNANSSSTVGSAPTSPSASTAPGALSISAASPPFTATNHKGNGENGEGAATPNAIRSMFQGVLEHYISADDANYRGSHEENFYDVQLVVKGYRNIYESLDAIVAPEVLDGKNKYCLERDGQKSYHRAEKGVRFKRLPPVLILHLARFDYDPEKGDMCKVLSRWDYYDEIDLSRYMTNCGAEADRQNTVYQLHSVLVHSGPDARFGHYYCFVKCASNERAPAAAAAVTPPTTGTAAPSTSPTASSSWYKFNDEVVSLASLKDVFGANFGGVKCNYWGTEVPLTTNAYVLVYLRRSDIATLLRPVHDDEVPQHVKQRLQEESELQEKRRRERAEAHLYGLLHFVSVDDVGEHPTLLTNPVPALQFPPHRTLRVHLTSDALTVALPFVAKQYGLEPKDIALWVATRTDLSTGTGDLESPSSLLTSCRKLGQRILPNNSVADYTVQTDGKVAKREVCVLVTSLSSQKGLSAAEARSAQDRNALVLTHHRFYDPVDLTIRFVDSLLADYTRPVSALHGAMTAALAEKGWLRCKSVTNDGTPSALPRMRILLEESTSKLVDVTDACGLSVRSGDVFVWQEVIDEPDVARNVIVANAEDFAALARRRVPVEIRKLSPPQFPKVLETELSDEMTYDQLQRFVANQIREEDTDRIRFSRFNPETQLPYFMKDKKSGGCTLRSLLTVKNHPKLNSVLYFEVCPFRVTDIESSNSFQFEWFDAHVRPGGAHWLLLPWDATNGGGPKMTDLFSRVLDVVACEEGGPSPSPQAAPRLPLPANPAEIRLVDVWKSRIYNVYDLNVPITTRFEESAEYRVEPAPQPIHGVPSDKQVLLHCFHFSRLHGGKVVTHGDPFSLFVSTLDTLSGLRDRICEVLSLTVQQVEDWKLCLVHLNRVSEIKATQLLGEQLVSFANAGPPVPLNAPSTPGASRHADPVSPLTAVKVVTYRTIGGGSGPMSIFQSNQKDGMQTAFIGLEHAAVANGRKGGHRREEGRGLKIFN